MLRQVSSLSRLERRRGAMTRAAAWESLKSWLVQAQAENFPYTVTQVLEKMEELEGEHHTHQDFMIKYDGSCPACAILLDEMNQITGEED